MAEPLKNHFGADIPRRLAAAIVAVWPQFSSGAFQEEALEGYEALELLDRGRRLARVLRRHLPEDYKEALGILMRSLGPRPSREAGDGGMASFFYLPHVCFVAEFGLEHFDASMQAQYELTKRFTAEFSIRRFIEHHEKPVFQLLRKWARDPDVHVRRLVSEGTRPRLPWAGRLRQFQRDPAPVLALLELLKDDPALYVRRSVANNLNDIGKDHPDLLVGVASRWWDDASAERKALVRHALRSLVKEGHAGALRVLGFGGGADATIEDVTIAPSRVEKGGKVRMTFAVRSTSRHEQRLLVDLRVHFVKASGSALPKVFKVKTVELEGGERATFRKTVSVADLTTRRHYPGRHLVDVLVNGRVMPIGAFVIAS